MVWQRILPFPPELFRGVRLRVWRHVARSVQGVVGLTETDIEEVRRLGFEGPAESIPNFRRPQRFAQVDRPRARARLGRELGLHDGVRIVGFVSRLVDQKRPDRALQVMRELRSRHVAAHLVIAGDGPLRADVEALARESGLEASTSFLGHRDDIEEVLGGLDVLLVTSASEGIPGTVIEAQMTGCPVIATDVGAIGSVVRSGVTGFVLDYDPQSLAQALTSVLEDPVRAAEMSRAARARGLEFSIDKVVSRYERFLTEIAGSRSR